MTFHKLGLVVGAVLAIVATGTYSGSANAQQELNLRFADFLPATLPQMQVDQWFADELDRRSSGKIKIKIFFGSALGKPTELLKLVSEGGVQIAATSPSYFPAQLPFLAPTNSLPLAFKDAPQAQKIIHTLYAETPALQEEMRQLTANKIAVIRFARKVGVSRGIVVGQLQHYGLIGRDQLNSLKRPYTWPAD